MGRPSGLNKAANGLMPSNQARTSTPRGQAGYDNARENIDPHVKTKVVDSQEAVTQCFYTIPEKLILKNSTTFGYSKQLQFNTNASGSTYARIYAVNSSLILDGATTVIRSIDAVAAGFYSIGAGTSFVDGTFTGTVQASKLKSTVATGTAPLTVTSTTVVTNLNADQLDGHHSSDFLTAEADTLGTVAARGNTTTTNIGAGPNISTNPGIPIVSGHDGGIGVELYSGDAPTAQVILSGGSIADGTYYYCYTTTDGWGETTRSGEVTVVVNGGGNHASVKVFPDMAKPVGAALFKLYRTQTAGVYTTPTYINNTSAVGSNYVLDTLATPNAGVPPTVCTAFTSLINGYGPGGLATGISHFAGGVFIIYGTTVDNGTIQLGNAVSNQYGKIRFDDSGNNSLTITTGYTGNGNYIVLSPGNSETLRVTKGTKNTAAVTGDMSATGDVKGATFHVGETAGIDATVTYIDTLLGAKTLTFTKGILTAQT